MLQASSRIIAKAPKLHPPIFHMNDVVGTKAFYLENGFVVAADAISALEIEAFLKEYVTKVLEQQPWKEKHPFEVYDTITQKKLDVRSEPKRYAESLFRPYVASKTLNKWKEGYGFHRGFGAMCDPLVFNLHSVWNVRQNPDLYNLASGLLEYKKLWVDINRCGLKLPGEGEDEWLHWDMPYLKSEWKESKSLAGKVAITETVLYCVPGALSLSWLVYLVCF
jgi:hypothetical protein